MISIFFYIITKVMNMMISEKMVDIEKRESIAENAIHYKILTHYQTKDVPGTADIFFKRLDHYKPVKPVLSNSLYRDCISKGYHDQDIIGHIKFFYPNGGNFKQSNMRHGVGTIVLERIISDALKHHGKMLYVFSTTDYMERFLKKKDFYLSSEFESQFYLDI